MIMRESSEMDPSEETYEAPHVVAPDLQGEHEHRVELVLSDNEHRVLNTISDANVVVPGSASLEVKQALDCTFTVYPGGKVIILDEDGSNYVLTEKAEADASEEESDEITQQAA